MNKIKLNLNLIATNSIKNNTEKNEIFKEVEMAMTSFTQDEIIIQSSDRTKFSIAEGYYANQQLEGVTIRVNKGDS